MTDELKKMLEASHADEIADHDKYVKMAKMADEEGYYHCAGILRDIADEEHSHMELIEHILNK